MRDRIMKRNDVLYKVKAGEVTRLDRLEDLPEGDWADDEGYYAISTDIVDNHRTAEMLAEVAAALYDWNMVQEDNYYDRAVIHIDYTSIHQLNKILHKLYSGNVNSWPVGNGRLYPVHEMDHDGNLYQIGYSDKPKSSDNWVSLNDR
jgi:hypothetical protein